MESKICVCSYIVLFVLLDFDCDFGFMCWPRNVTPVQDVG